MVVWLSRYFNTLASGLWGSGIIVRHAAVSIYGAVITIFLPPGHMAGFGPIPGFGLAGRSAGRVPGSTAFTSLEATGSVIRGTGTPRADLARFVAPMMGRACSCNRQ